MHHETRIHINRALNSGWCFLWCPTKWNRAVKFVAKERNGWKSEKTLLSSVYSTIQFTTTCLQFLSHSRWADYEITTPAAEI